jgi:LPS sulfotransferase NodH
MLEGIETGYEERYDFPYRADPPEHAYLLATVPRTGSSFVSHLLWQSGCLGAPLEYLNFVPTGPARFAVDDPEQQAALWRSMLHVRTSPNGVFGLKCFPAQLRTLQKFNPPLFFEVMNLLFRGPGARVVRLRRRDGLAHAISYARALTSGVWRKEQEQPSAGGVAYADGAIDRARQMLDEQEAEWDALFAELGIAALELWYEDIIGEPEAAVCAVASHIGVELDPAAALSIYQVERQSQKDALRWRERYQTQKKEI